MRIFIFTITIPCSVSSTIDDLFNTTQVSSTCSIKSKSLLHGKSLCGQNSESKNTSTMSSGDILNYIQENTVPSESDLELFS